MRKSTERVSRRALIGSALSVGATLAVTRFALAAGPAASGDPTSDARFVLVLLRGALDGLAAVPPYGDPAYASLRRELAIGAPGTARGALALDGTFGLHPALAFLHTRWAARELAILHAIATPYRERSHFDAQDLLENGGTRAHEFSSGWLNRALAAVPSRGPAGAAGGAARAADRAARSAATRGVALGANIPLVLRGPVEVASWSPSRLEALDEDTLSRIQDLYARDSVLSMRLADALTSDRIATEAQQVQAQTAMPAAGTTARPARAAARGGLLETMRAAAGFLTRPDGARIAVLETTGWDTHANQGADQGLLALRLGALDAGLRALHDALGAQAWSRTVVVLATEFGRTAAANGTRGTDHGTGAAAFLVGGAVAGGRVIADWPGLASASLHEGRDLKPTRDLRAALKGVLHEHLGAPERALNTDVFPNSGSSAAIMRGLVRDA